MQGIVFSLFLLVTGANTAFVHEGVYIQDSDGSIFAKLRSERSDLTFDHIQSGARGSGFEVYGPKGFKAWLKSRHVEYVDKDRLDFLGRAQSAYPSFVEIQDKLHALAAKYPKLIQLFSIGKSIEGRDLWVVKLSSEPTVDRKLPEVKYISSMHGNEITGRELMIQLIDDLASGYGCNEEITNFLNHTEVFIMPSMNPDGSERPYRGNAVGADLNRDFPDFSSDNVNTGEGRQPETKAVMKFQASRHFALSANFHGGAEVVNYPWDTIPDTHPFDQLVKDLSLEYASQVPYIKNSTSFVDGITNGYAWYEVDGGMQDWSYHWYGDLQLTIELSDQKWPDYESIPNYYQENKSALIRYLMDVHQGAGVVFDRPNVSGKIEIFSADQKSLGSYPFSDSEFYKVLPVGEYQLQVKVDGASSAAPLTGTLTVDAKHIYSGGNYLRFP